MDTYLKPIIAYRLWKTATFSNSLYLVSLHRTSIWYPFLALDASCNVFTHESPAFHVGTFSCGIYGLNSYHRSKNYHPLDSFYPYEVYGLVYLWGRITEHKQGYRAQHAYPAAILDTPNNRLPLSTLASLYKIPIIKCNLKEAQQFIEDKNNLVGDFV